MLSNAKYKENGLSTINRDAIDNNFEMTDRRRRRPKVAPRAATDFVR